MKPLERTAQAMVVWGRRFRANRGCLRKAMSGGDSHTNTGASAIRVAGEDDPRANPGDADARPTSNGLPRKSDLYGIIPPGEGTGIDIPGLSVCDFTGKFARWGSDGLARAPFQGAFSRFDAASRRFGKNTEILSLPYKCTGNCSPKKLIRRGGIDVSR